MYLREMGTVPLLTREGEVEIARRIERGQNTVLKSLSRSPLVIQEILAMGEEVEREQLSARDVIQHPAIRCSPTKWWRRSSSEFVASLARYRRGSTARPLQCRQKLLAIPRGIKPKQHRRSCGNWRGWWCGLAAGADASSSRAR